MERHPTKKIDKSIVIGLLARDCKKNLQTNIPRIETLGNLFREYHVIAYENDSADGTKELLQRWMQDNPCVISINEVTGEQTIPPKSRNVLYPGQSLYRITKMAVFRNRILKELRLRFCPDFFCFIDVDVEIFDPREIVKGIEQAPKDWGALFANGQIILDYGTHTCVNPIQYDYYAYFKQGMNPYQSGDYTIRINDNLAVAWMEQRKINRHNYHPCFSAFNGIGIYRWAMIKDLSYCAYQTPELKGFQASLCEHVPFNYEIVKRGYKLYIVRDMKTIMRHDRAYVHHGLSKWRNYYPSYDFLNNNRAVIPLIFKYYFCSQYRELYNKIKEGFTKK